ncbi:transcriptional regulator GlxA family with amidase domain [Rhodobium orientis]|uniref:AraC family transcriptional regulator n=1 Tax=Rhodobium orientis TaxID=34017 RepID=A0A327JS69_9HYPH|nr:GlxA family transcriptional regulator [Rhodobium orientis]MBB4303671.1 transcriptional regulator GlxA family with amidase domain [Rhodobium orientis]MBK5951874.1 AraC family transcriptional regulator [Rhodobium orientis]RAI28465.1 AraC family transcriptional regulator [Rhodobium orientis]
MGDSDPPAKRFAFVLIPDFTLVAFSAAIEPLRLANRYFGRKIYDWRCVTCDGNDVAASNGLTVRPDGSLGDLRLGRMEFDKVDTLVVCAGIDVESFTNAELSAYLRKLAGNGTRIAGICTSSWFLARSGILEDRRCTIHWELLHTFAERFPDVDVQPDLFEVDGNIHTCAGGVASLDMMLDLIADEIGDEATEWISEQCLVDRVRTKNDRQKLPLNARVGVHNSKLLAMIEVMEQNLAEPLSLAEISRRTGLSRRHVERLFRQLLGRSPARYYLDLRLDRARQLLLQSDMAIVDVAIASGFVSASHFSKCYRELYGRSPQADRQASLTERAAGPKGGRSAPL